jgi:predicted nucleic acid-binding protein
MSQSIHDFSEDTLYLDTMVFYEFLRAIEPATKLLFSRIRAGEWRAYSSVLTFDELAYRLLLALIRDNHPGSPYDHLRQNEAQMIAAYYPRVSEQLQQLQVTPNLILLDVNVSDLAMMHEAAATYHLRPRDALHVAAIQKCGCFNLVSNDGDFDRVPGVQRFTLP